MYYNEFNLPDRGVVTVGHCEEYIYHSELSDFEPFREYEREIRQFQRSNAPEFHFMALDPCDPEYRSYLVVQTSKKMFDKLSDLVPCSFYIKKKKNKSSPECISSGSSIPGLSTGTFEKLMDSAVEKHGMYSNFYFLLHDPIVGIIVGKAQGVEFEYFPHCHQRLFYDGAMNAYEHVHHLLTDSNKLESGDKNHHISQDNNFLYLHECGSGNWSLIERSSQMQVEGAGISDYASNVAWMYGNYVFGFYIGYYATLAIQKFWKK